ncbi:MAG: Transaldolase [Alphaproteobacteria bacterium MarineAlpha6_Bin4]|nr:MAG: Transaldolase [Alphaproteobacteria bacterium MarineAlpha6_Bin4]|tara:strand:+ start:8842 stop:9498 length:657 start_codon:yes stop_codon:yes gene_type:complete
MEFFVDTADINEIKRINNMGILDGVTTNPSLVAKSNKNFKQLIKEICKVVNGPVSAEVTATKFEEMYKEGIKLSKIAKNVVVKVPLTVDGIITCKKLSKKNIGVNVTLCFSSNQAILAAKAGAKYISPFIGRLDDVGKNGVSLIEEIKKIYSNYKNFKTKILAASIRSTKHIEQVAIAGADVATVPPKLLEEMFKHPLTNKGLKMFLEDWKKTKQKIL